MQSSITHAIINKQNIAKISENRVDVAVFYDIQTKSQQDIYKHMLAAVGSLSQLFSDNSCPYMPYRVHENVFTKSFQAENLSRYDCSIDVKKGHIGIGLKTWVGSDDQKIAEFGKLRETYFGLTGLDLVRKISEYRNERIRITKNLYGIDEFLYHIIKRVPGSMQIIEHAFDSIDLEKIVVLTDRGTDNNTYFYDGKHTYHFSISKNTLYMIFDGLEIMDTFGVEIMADPYNYLMNLTAKDHIVTGISTNEKIDSLRTGNKVCLRLYSTRADGTKYVFEKSGLNQWNAAGRRRDPNEVYIPYPSEDRLRTLGFFPPRDKVFNLTLPDGSTIPAKICQADGKAIMSNPNKILGEWLLRKVFELKEGTLITYQMLEIFGIDSVVFTKESDLSYSIDFSVIGTYENFYNPQNNN